MHQAARASILFLVTGGWLVSSLPAQSQTDTGVGIFAVSAGGLFGLGGHGSYGASLAEMTGKPL